MCVFKGSRQHFQPAAPGEQHLVHITFYLLSHINTASIKARY